MLQLKLKLPRNKFTISVELNVETGTTLCLFGPSGTGKSSILSTIAGFESDFDEAYLAVDGNVLLDTSTKPPISCPPWRRKMGYMEQSARIFPHMTVKQNILYGTTSHRDRNWFVKIVEATGLQDELATRPHQLSGGMAQRVALARALAAKPSVLLLDEPFSALDATARRQLQDLVKSVHNEFSITTLLVTHQLTEAQRMADRIALLQNGLILQNGSPSRLINEPTSWSAAQLMGYTSMLENDHERTQTRFLIHPDRVVLGQQPELGIPVLATVQEVLWHEGRQRLHLNPCEPWRTSHPLEVNLPAMEPFHIGERVTITAVRPPTLPASTVAAKH